MMRPLHHDKLRWICPASALTFRSTKELEPLRAIVGQDRAVESIRLGAALRHQGYNIYVSGVIGTGRMTTIRNLLDEIRHDSPELFDFAYVHNFKQTDQPVLLRFHRGEGRVFASMMNDAMQFLRRRIAQLFEEDQFQTERKAIIQRFQEGEKSMIAELDERIRPKGLAVGQLQEESGDVRTEIFPIIDEKPYAIEQLEELVQANTITMNRAVEIRKAWEQHRDELSSIGRRSMRLMTDFRKELAQHDQRSVSLLVDAAFESVRASFPRDRVTEFLGGVRAHLLDRLDELIRLITARATAEDSPAAEEAIIGFFNLYGVNLIVDNYDTTEAPVVVETSPTYASLFGTIDKRYDHHGFYTSDFSLVRAGSVLRAHGGYIVMNAVDVLSDPAIWQTLRRVMLYGRLDIQSSDGQFQLNSLKPEFIKLNVKVILLGDPEIYLALWSTDEDFHKMFKVHAQFDTTTKLNTAMITNYARFFSLLASEEGLLHCDRGGAAALIEWAVAFAETQEQISLQFSYVADMMREADHYARAVRSTLIRRTHVQQAIDQRQWRSNRVDQDIREQIRKGTMLIDVTGTRVGQINGLTVYSTGIISFGKPSRITCTVSAGNAGIINIEREVDLSGAIHNKGVLILSGLLRSLFSRSQPISFTSSIAFEQSYGGVDGDSASVTEMIALLSAISNIPITQALAITGSINQKGDIQPIGGVNEKITGFYEVCKDRGLTGAQGVIIPKQNVKDLMLNDEIIEAVKQKKFAIYPVETVSDAVELMMGVPAGRIGRNGAFPEGTVYAKVQHNLDVLHEASRSSWLGPAKA